MHFYLLKLQEHLFKMVHLQKNTVLTGLSSEGAEKGFPVKIKKKMLLHLKVKALKDRQVFRIPRQTR